MMQLSGEETLDPMLAAPALESLLLNELFNYLNHLITVGPPRDLTFAAACSRNHARLVIHAGYTVDKIKGLACAIRFLGITLNTDFEWSCTSWTRKCKDSYPFSAVL